MGLIIGRLAGILTLNTTGFDTKLAGSVNKMRAFGGRLSTLGGNLTRWVTLPLVGVGGVAVKTAVDFEKSMNTMQAVAGVTGGKLDRLRNLAIKLGRDTVFSANDAAGAMLELSKAGVDTSDIMGGALKNTLDLAAAGELDLADAARIASNAMNTFGLNGEQSKIAVDALAGAANASSADVDDLAQALQMGGQAAADANWSIEETTAALAMMADKGLQGSDAGTSLKTMLLRLVPSTDKAAESMRSLGIDFVDNKGRIDGLETVARKLQGRLGGLSQAQRQTALKTMFGTDAYRAASIVLKGGAKDVRRYTAETSKSGNAAAVAKKKMEGLPGAIEMMKGSLETAALAFGNALAPAIRTASRLIGGLADRFTNLHPSVQTAIAVLLGLGAAAGPVMWLTGKFNLLKVSVFQTLVPLRQLQAATALSGQKMNLAQAATTTWASSLAAGATKAGLLLVALLPLNEVLNGGGLAMEDVRYQTDKLLESFKSGAIDARDYRYQLGQIAQQTEGGKNFSETWRYGLQKLNDLMPQVNKKTGKMRVEVGHLGRELDKTRGKTGDARRSLTRFAGMTGKKLAQWRTDTRESVGGVSSVLGDLANKSKVTVTKILRHFRRQATAIRNMGNNLKTLAQQNYPQSFLKDLSEMGLEGAVIADKLVNAQGGMRKKIKAALGDLEKATKGYTDFTRRELGSKAPGAVRDAGRKIGDESRTAAGRLIDPFQDSASKAPGLGRDIGYGIANGLRQAAPGIYDQADDIAAGITSRISKALDVKSPSRVMRRIGFMAGEGLRLGLADSAGRLERQSARLAAAVAGARFSGPGIPRIGGPVAAGGGIGRGGTQPLRGRMTLDLENGRAVIDFIDDRANGAVRRYHGTQARRGRKNVRSGRGN